MPKITDFEIYNGKICVVGKSTYDNTFSCCTIIGFLNKDGTVSRQHVQLYNSTREAIAVLKRFYKVQLTFTAHDYFRNYKNLGAK